MSKLIRRELDLAGKKLVLETGELAGHANGSVLATYGETVMLATAVAQKASLNFDFFPLSVDYEEKLYAGGKIHTSRFIKREGRPSEKAILTSRLIDRSIRPLFPKDYQAEVQVVLTVLSYDAQNDPDVVSLVAASAALSISDIPWNGPLAAVRVGRKESEFLLNPTEDEKQLSSLDLVIAHTKDEIVMIEADAQEVEEKTVHDAIQFGLKEGQAVLKLIQDFTKEAGKPKQEYEKQVLNPTIAKNVRDFIDTNIMKNFEKNSQDEGWFADTLKTLEEEFIAKQEGKIVKESGEEEITPKILASILEDIIVDRLRSDILDHKKRPDGRTPDEIRPITIKVPVLPRTHGSAIFQRGETQVLSIATLGSPALEQLIDGMSGEETKKYMHHYNFPPFSTGEVKRLGSPGRREIGHGALAEKALLPVLPSTDEFPYTIRIVSEVLSSAGSTSMASACGSTLALMDAGVPIKEPVAGISIGLITDKADKSKYITIVDIAYQEDAQGDMDFKVAGTKNGICAIQMDTKLSGISTDVCEEALEKAKKARLAILEKMSHAIPTSRKSISQHAPTVILVKIDPSKIGEVIGGGGKTINKIIAETGSAIDIKDDGTVMISAKEAEAAQKAASWVEGIVKEAQVGEVYEGPVKRILPFGAMVEILPGKEGLVHISQMAPYRVEKVEDVVKIGQTVKVRVFEIDDMGRVNLSMKFGADADKENSGSERREGFGRQEDRSRGRQRSGGRFDRRQRPRPPKRY